MTKDVPQLDYGIVAFTDILGFRSMVERDSVERPPEFLSRIIDALDELQTELESHDVAVTQFSDSVVLETKFSPQQFAVCLEAVQRLQQVLITREISVRGGIAFGYHYGADGRIFSQALVKAYEIESGVARFPRVVVDPNLLDAALNHDDLDPRDRDRAHKLLMLDRDGSTFVHYLEAGILPAHATLLESQLCRRDLPAGVLEKLHWQADYHNFIAGQTEGQDPLVLDALRQFMPLPSVEAHPELVP